MEQLSHNNKMNVTDAFSILRDHGSLDYSPDSHFLMNQVCAHSANKIARNASQSTASMVTSLKKEDYTFWATGTSAPCTSIFKPIWFNGDVLPYIGPKPEGKYTPNSLWWDHEKLHRRVLMDFQKRHQILNNRRIELEKEFYDNSINTESDKFYDLTKYAFEKSKQFGDDILNELNDLSIEKKPKSSYRKYWKTQNMKAEILAHL